jgi:hypothetical protein
MGWAPRTLVKKTIAIGRSPKMLSEHNELQSIGAPAPDWLKKLIRSVRRGAILPNDPRVKSLCDLLRQRQLLRRSRWLEAVLRRIWTRGLSARPHPRTARRIVYRLRRWGLLPPKSARAGPHRLMTARPLTSAAVQTMRPVTLTPVASVRPAAMQPVRPIRMESTAMLAARK